MTRPVHVVVVAYHAPELLDRALTALEGGPTVTVVDNSASASVREVCDARGATYVAMPNNVGFAAGVNAGIRSLLDGHPTDILLLNPDAAIRSDALLRLAGTLRADERIAAVAPRLRDEDGVEERVLWPFPSPRLAWIEALGLARFLPATSGFATGAVLLLRWEALRRLGLFDERFFLYAEEADWERRAVDDGWQVVLAKEVTALHRRAATSTDARRQERLFFAAQEIYIRKWYGTRGWLAYRAAVVLGAVLRAVVLRGQGRRRAQRRLRLFLHGPHRAAFE